MINNGVLMPWIALSYAHGEKEMEFTLEAVRKALIVYSNALNDGVEKVMRHKRAIIKPVFRTFN